MDNNQYLILLDKDGQRITSLLLGIHGQTMDELKEKAKTYNPAILLEADEAMQQQFVAGKLYVEGKFIDPPAYEPTKEDIRYSIIKEYELKLDRLRQALISRQAMGEDVKAIQEAYKGLIEEQKTKLKEVQ